MRFRASREGLPPVPDDLADWSFYVDWLDDAPAPVAAVGEALHAVRRRHAEAFGLWLAARRSWMLEAGYAEDDVFGVDSLLEWPSFGAAVIPVGATDEQRARIIEADPLADVVRPSREPS